MSKKTNAKKDEQQTVTVFADSPVKYNGKRYFNESFDADEDTANELIESGTCSPAKPEENNDQPGREEILHAAIAQLKPDQFEADGKPMLKALSKVTKSVVTEEERNAAWSTFNTGA